MSKDYSNPQHISLAVNTTHLPVKLLQSRVLHGYNIYHSQKVIRQRVDMGGLAGIRSSAAGPDFASKFVDRFVGLEKMTPTGHMNNHFLQRLNEPAGAPFIEVLFEAILAVEASMAFTTRNLAPLRFAEICATHSPAWYDLIWECSSPKISRDAAAIACAGLLELLPDSMRIQSSKDSDNFFTGLAKLKATARRRQHSTTSAVIALAAKKRGLPCEFLGAAYLQLGHGIAQRTIHDSFCGDTLPANKQATQAEEYMHSTLLMNELPLPEQWPAATIQEACQIADTFGYPVFLKPLKGNQASRMNICIHSPADMTEAFEQARRDGKGVMVEKFVRGQSHRLLIIGGQCVGALHIMPPTVVGDGIRTIYELIDELNNDPLRNGVRQYRVEVNRQLARSLKYGGYNLLDVPANGDEVQLYPVADVMTGATHSDVTDIIHPDNKEIAVKAAAANRLQVAGIDLITTDITSSYLEVGGNITNINSQPELWIHRWPRHGKSRDVGGELLKLAFPRGGNGRIPIALVAGERGTARIARNFDRLMRESGKSVGLSLPSNSTIAGRPLEQDTSQRKSSSRFLLQDPRTEMVVGTASPRLIVRHGLDLERCDVAAIRDPVADEKADVYRLGLGILIKATRGTLVINASNQTALDMLLPTDTHRLLLVSPEHSNSRIKTHLDSGHIAASAAVKNNQQHIFLRTKEKTLVSLPVATLLNVRGSRTSQREILDSMYVLGMAYGMGLRGYDLESLIATRPELKTVS